LTKTSPQDRKHTATASASLCCACDSDTKWTASPAYKSH